MAEHEWVLDAPDGKKIYGLISTETKKKNNAAILYIPGLGGDCMDYAAVRMAFKFPKAGYDVIRMNLYGWHEDARKLSDCTIQQHAIDIDHVVKYFKKKYKKVFAVGHSYGGPSLMSSKINQFSAVSLWDPSFIPQMSAPEDAFDKAGNYRVAFGFLTLPVLVKKEFVSEAKKFDREYAITLAKKCKAPLQVVYAGKEAFWIDQGESFHTHAKGPTDERVVKQTQHFFYEEGAVTPLLRYVKNWFDQF